MLTQVLLARAEPAGIVDHHIDGFKLMIAREDQRFGLVGHTELIYLLFGFHIYKTMEDSQPGIAPTDLFPKVGHGVFTITAGFVTGVTLITFVKRQEKTLIAFQFGTHDDFAIAHGKVHHGTTLEGQ